MNIIMAKKSEVYREKMSTKSGKIIMVISRRGQIYSATPLSETGVALPYANYQSRLNMGNDETEADVIKRTIARSIEKYELSNKAQTRQHTDYTAAFNTLSSEECDRLCPPQWRAASTRKAALVFYIQNIIPLIQQFLSYHQSENRVEYISELKNFLGKTVCLAFTDPTGRDYLWRRLRLDRHGLPESVHKAQYKRMSRVKGPDYDELRFPAPNDGRDMLITLRLATKGLNVGDAIEVIADEGCFLDVINN